MKYLKSLSFLVCLTLFQSTYASDEEVQDEFTLMEDTIFGEWVAFEVITEGFQTQTSGDPGRDVNWLWVYQIRQLAYEMLEILDDNGDGYIDEEEVVRRLEAICSAATNDEEAEACDVLMEFMRDGEFPISIRYVVNRLIMPQFRRVDLNNDGKITLWEWRQFQRNNSVVPSYLPILQVR